MQYKTLFRIVIRWLGLKFAVLAIIMTTIAASNAFAAKYQIFVSFAGNGVLGNNVASRGFRHLPIVYGRYIDLNHDGKLDLKQYIPHIRKKFLDYMGPVAIDWEGKAYRHLIGIDQPAMRTKDVIDEYVKSLKLLQSISAKQVEIGFYGFPSKASTRSDSTMEEAKKLQKIYAGIDILYPSLYINSSSFSKYSPIKFTKKHLRNALRVACEGDKRKKVYAFITHRFHPNSRSNPNSLIPFDVFENYIEAIRDVRYGDCKIDGIVWWGADEHWYEKGWRKEIVTSIDSYSSIMEYNDKVIEKYADIILEYFGG